MIILVFIMTELDWFLQPTAGCLTSLRTSMSWGGGIHSKLFIYLLFAKYWVKKNNSITFNIKFCPLCKWCQELTFENVSSCTKIKCDNIKNKWTSISCWFLYLYVYIYIYFNLFVYLFNIEHAGAPDLQKPFRWNLNILLFPDSLV